MKLFLDVHQLSKRRVSNLLCKSVRGISLNMNKIYLFGCRSQTSRPNRSNRHMRTCVVWTKTGRLHAIKRWNSYRGSASRSSGPTCPLQEQIILWSSLISRPDTQKHISYATLPSRLVLFFLVVMSRESYCSWAKLDSGPTLVWQ